MQDGTCNEKFCLWSQKPLNIDCKTEILISATTSIFNFCFPVIYMSYLKMQRTFESKEEISGNSCGSQSYCIYEVLFIRSPVVNTEAAAS